MKNRGRKKSASEIFRRQRMRSQSTPCTELGPLLAPLKKETRNHGTPWPAGSLDKILRDMEDRFYFVSPSSSTQPSLSGDEKDDEDDDEDWEEEMYARAVVPEPPDGGYGWVIVAASFLCNMIVDGIAYTFGIFFTEFVRYYEAPKGQVAWVGSLMSGFYLSVGPLVSALTNRFGCRVVTIIGSIVACIAFLLSTLSPTVDILMLTYGVMAGIGFGMVFLPAVVSVGYYFSTKRALATGIAVCGSGMGGFLFAPFCQKLLDIYDWKGATIILAGLCLHCTVFGALMRPLESTLKTTKPLLQRIAEEKERHRNESICGSQFTIIQHIDGTLEKRPKFVLNLEPGVHSTLYLDHLGKSPADTPVFTLSPIQEIRRSPASSKEDEMDDKDEKAKNSKKLPEQQATSTALAAATLSNSAIPAATSSSSAATTSVTATTAISSNSADQPDSSSQQHQQPQVPNGSVPPTAIRELAKRKGLLPNSNSHGAMKISLSNITVNKEMRRNNSALKFSSSGYLCSGSQNPPQQQNNNYAADEVWKRSIREQPSLPLDGSNSSRRSSLKRDRKDYCRPLYRKDVFYSGSIRNLPEYKQSQGDVRSYVASVTSIPRDNYATQASVPDTVAGGGGRVARSKICPDCLKLPKSMTDTMSEMLDFSLLKNQVFLLICISNIVGMVGFYVPYVYITDSSVMKGVPADQAAFLLSAIGITNTFGRVMFGWLSDRPGVSALLVNNISMAMTGICVFIMPFCNSYTAIIIDCTLFGLFVSAYISLTSIILVELLGLDKLTNAFGLLSLFRGFSCMIGPPLAGAMYDKTGSYDLPFYAAGILLLISAGLSFMVPFVVKRNEKVTGEDQVQSPMSGPMSPVAEERDMLSDDESVV